MKKCLNVILSLLLAITTLWSVNVVKADGYTLTSTTILNDMFDLSPYTQGHVAALEASTPYGAVDAYCIEPNVLTHAGDVYNGSSYSGNDSARQALMNYYKNYRGNELWGTKAGYYATQLAIWGRIKGIDPADLTILSSLSNNQKTLAGKVRSFASSLYNSSTVVSNATHYVYDNSAMGDGYVLSDSDKVYFYKGQAYFRSAPMTITGEGTVGSIAFSVTTDNGFVVNSKNAVANDFGYGTDNGTIFYVYSPIEEETTNVTISGNYKYVDVMTWDFASGPYGFGQRMMSLDVLNGALNKNISFTHTARTLSSLQNSNGEPYTGTFKFTKTGLGVTGFTTDESNYGIVYHLTSDKTPLANATFGIYMSSGAVLVPASNILYRTDEDGYFEASNLPLTMNGEGWDSLVVCEVEAPTGYGKFTNPTALVDASTGYSCLRYKFDSANAENNVITRTVSESNSAKTFDITINKTDQNGMPVANVEFVIRTTEEMDLSTVVLPAGSIVGLMKTNASGVATFNDYLPATQDYFIEEVGVNAIPTYTFDGADYEDGVYLPVMKQEALHSSYVIDVENEMTAGFSILKLDAETEEPMEGVSISLVNENYLYTGETDADGVIVFDAVAYGTYEVIENETPDGYEVYEGTTVSIPAQRRITVKNKPFATGAIDIKKVISGSPVSDKTFYIDYTVERETHPEKNYSDYVELVGEDASTIKFTFEEEDVYTVTLQERDTEETGYTYDDSSYVVVFEVNRDSDGLLVAEASSDDILTWTNTYTPVSTNQTIAFNKELVVDHGVNSATDNFVISINNGPVEIAELNLAKNSSAYYNFVFNSPGTYTFQVNEVNEGLPNYTYDSATHTIVFTVTDNDGALQIVQTLIDGLPGNEVSFSNHYSQPYDALDVSVVIDKKIDGVQAKTLLGEKIITDEFTWSITDGSNSLGTINIVGEDTNYWNYSFTSAGTYNLYIKENTLTDTNWTIDSNTYKLVIVVDDVVDTIGHYAINSAKLYKGSELVRDYGTSAIYTLTCHNEYTPTPITDDIRINKEVSNLTAQQASYHEFTFDVNGDDTYIDGEGQTDYTVTFDAPGTYTYTITEDPTVSFENNTDVFTVDYIVSLNGKTLQLDSKVIKKNGNVVDEITFVNTYVVPDGEYKVTTIEIGKETNVSTLSSEKFYALVNEVPYEIKTSSPTSVDLYVTNVGTWNFEIKERNDAIENWEYDTTVYTATAIVSQDGLGVKLDSLVIKDNEEQVVDEITFVNTYHIPEVLTTVGNITVNKQTNIATDEEFEYTVNGSAKTIIAGTPSYYPISVASVGTYEYVIRETNLEYPNWHFDTNTTYRVVAEVGSVERDLVLTSLTVYKNDILTEDDIVFTNYYVKPINASVTVNKQWNLNNTDAATLVSNFAVDDVLTKSITGNDSTTIDFTFDRAGTYTYTISEIPSADSHIMPNNTAYNVTFIVSENDHVLSVEQNIEEITFNNLYIFDAVSTDFVITKKIIGTPSTSSYFSFAINDNPVTSVKGAGNTSITRAYTLPGTYIYKVSEVDGKVAGYTYDDSEYCVVVKVEIEDMKLTCIKEYYLVNNEILTPVDGIVFTNTYTNTIDNKPIVIPPRPVPNTATE